ncbi:hypothetical protein S83_006487 [Arachis hypogaea]
MASTSLIIRYPLPKPTTLPFTSNLSSIKFKPLQTTTPLSFPSIKLKPFQFTTKLINKPYAAAAASTTTTLPPPQPWQGAKLKPLLASVATGLILWLLPSPSGVPRNAWQLLSIFMATIVGIITQPLPLGAVAIMGLCTAVLTKTLTYAAAFSAFGDQIPWLVALAFFFAKGFIKTGLGTRIAYHVVSLAGSSSLGLGYSLVLSEALLAPAIPSVSARAGGIILPLVKSLSEACGSNVGDGTESKLGSWLTLTCFQTSVISSAMFLTAMAANPLCGTLARGAIGRGIGWSDWAVAAAVPGAVSLVVVPLILYVIYPPGVKNSPDAPRVARDKLQLMGPMTLNENIMAATLFLTVRHHFFFLISHIMLYVIAGPCGPKKSLIKAHSATITHWTIRHVVHGDFPMLLAVHTPHN